MYPTPASAYRPQTQQPQFIPSTPYPSPSTIKYPYPQPMNISNTTAPPIPAHYPMPSSTASNQQINNFNSSYPVNRIINREEVYINLLLILE